MSGQGQGQDDLENSQKRTFCDVTALALSFLLWSSSNLVRSWTFMTRSSSKMGHVGSKTRSLGQIIEKACYHSRSYSFHWIIMKIGQHVCLDEFYVNFESGSTGSKTRPLGQIIEKACYHSGSHSFHWIFMKIGQLVCLDEFLIKFESGSCYVKN